MRFADVPIEHQSLFCSLNTSYDEAVEVQMCLQKLCPDFPFVINSLLKQYTKAKITEHISVEKLKDYGYSTADIANISCEAGMLLASD